MDLGIRDRVSLVAASARGMGLATAKRLAMEDVHVAICDKDESVLDQAVEVVAEVGNGNRVVAYPVDLTAAEQIEALVANVWRDLGPISILVTNSGGRPPGAFNQATDEKSRFAYDLSFLSAARLIMKRLAEPDEPAAAATFPASELAGYIKGVSLLVDGGAVRAL